MTAGYKNASVDFDALFDPDIVGDGPTAAGYKSGGDLLQYAALKYGTKRANVGYAVASIDVSNLWAAKGTASYALAIDGNNYNAGVIVPSGSSGNVGLTFTLTSASAWAVTVARAGGSGSPVVGNQVTGSVPTGASKVRYTLTHTPDGSDTGAANVTNTATTATACANGVLATVSLGGPGNGPGKHSVYTLVITFTNAAGASISVTTITFVLDQEGSA